MISRRGLVGGLVSGLALTTGLSAGPIRLRVKGSGGGGSSIINGLLDDATVGQAYSSSLVVTPPGSITLSAATASWIASRTIAHDGSGGFSSAGVS